MQEEYLPAVPKAPTRVGQVTALTLMQRANVKVGDDAEKEFLLQVGWSGLPTDTLRVDDEEVVRKFEAFGTSLTPVGFYDTAYAWPGEITG